MIKVSGQGSVEDRLKKLEHSVNYSEVTLSWSQGGALSFGLAPSTDILSWAVDRSVFRKLLPDARWVVYAAGMVNPNDANTAIIGINYLTDAAANVGIGSVSQAGAGFVKKTIGPFDLFATGGVPAGETVPMLRLLAVKNAGAAGTAIGWTMWLRLLAGKQ